VVLRARPWNFSALHVSSTTLHFLIFSFEPIESQALIRLVAITGFPPGTYTGTKYVANAASSALADGKNAYNQIVTMGGYELLTGNLAGMSLGPGVYKYSSSASLAAGGVLTLVGTGSSTDTWIFQIGSLLVTGYGL
jgi:hypothetical protein